MQSDFGPKSYATDTYSFSLINLDSVYYYYDRQAYTFDSADVSFTPDTIYRTWVHDSSYCRAGEDEYYELFVDSTEYALGIGEIFSERYFPFCGSYYIKKLIYCHKANGKVFGIPYDFAVGINDPVNEKEISLFPNPAYDNFQLQFSEQPPKATYLQIYDGLGRMVRQEEITSLTTTINRENLTNGLYLWQLVNTSGGLKRGKLILQ
jgi:hypothetical protein